MIYFFEYNTSEVWNMQIESLWYSCRFIIIDSMAKKIERKVVKKAQEVKKEEIIE